MMDGRVDADFEHARLLKIHNVGCRFSSVGHGEYWDFAPFETFFVITPPLGDSRAVGFFMYLYSLLQ